MEVSHQPPAAGARRSPSTHPSTEKPRARGSPFNPATGSSPEGLATPDPPPRPLRPPLPPLSNVNTSAEPLLEGLVKKWAVFQAGPFKVATVGWITPDTAFLMLNTGNVTFSEARSGAAPRPLPAAPRGAGPE
jgi:hypothetical protein